MLRLDEIALQPVKPELVVTEANAVQGLDLLGLRTPAEAVANRLLDGVTTITPTVRYLSVRCWLIMQYLKLGGLNNWEAFSAFAAKVEAAIAYASTLVEDPTLGVVGRNVAARIVTATDSGLPTKRLTKILAANLYAGPSEALGLGESGGNVPTLTKERGLPLAESIDTVLGNDQLLSAISVGSEEQVFDRAELVEFGHRFSLATPSVDERRRLIAAIIPDDPRQKERARIASYCLLLHLSRSLRRTTKESDVYVAATQQDLSRIPEELHIFCDGWVRFAVRDLLVLVHEAAVWNVLRQLSQAPGIEKRQQFREVIAALVSENMDPALAALGLEIGVDQPIRKLYDAVIASFGTTREVRGLRRWSGALSETLLFEKAAWLQTGAGLCLLPIAWIMAAHRLEPGIKLRSDGVDLDDLAGTSRIGVGAVILPEVKSWCTGSMSIREAIAWLVHRSVDQHFRITWSRLAREPYKDVGLIRSDGDDWIYQKDFGPGRATSRLYQAISWLSQLCLLDDSGVTAEGSAVLDAGLATLHRRRTN